MFEVRVHGIGKIASLASSKQDRNLEITIATRQLKMVMKTRAELRSVTLGLLSRCASAIIATDQIRHANILVTSLASILCFILF